MTMPSESPTRMKSTSGSMMRGGVGVIGGQRDDRLAALPGADVVRRQPAGLDFYGHVGDPGLLTPSARRRGPIHGGAGPTAPPFTNR